MFVVSMALSGVGLVVEITLGILLLSWLFGWPFQL